MGRLWSAGPIPSIGHPLLPTRYHALRQLNSSHLWECIRIGERLPRRDHVLIWEVELQTDMARRALLTDRERELIAEEDTEEENYRYQAISRVRNKIEDELPQDVELLREHHPQLLSELREVVCDDE